MRSVIQQRGFCKSQITRAHNNATKFVEDIQSIPTLVARLAQLQDNYLRFVRLTEDLYAYESEEGWEDPAEDVDIYEEKHYATYAILSNTLEDLRLKSHVDFSGNYEDWKHFSDMFTASIASNTNFTDCQRFHYLKSYLSGEALALVKHIPVTNENYSEAWDKLEKRYNKKPLIIRSFLNSFLTLPSATTSSISTVRKLVDGADEVIRSYTACDDHITPAVTHHADLDTMVRSFMEMDNVQPNQSLLDSNDPTESHFANTHTRSEDGVYIVEYPFKDGAPPIESTLPQATNRLVSLERRFRRHPELKKQYEEFLDDYLQRGHMEQLTSAQVMDDPDTCVYLPHHAVIKQDSLTTKCRVVFDGSGKDSSGISLNDRLHIGPPIQRDLLGVCLLTYGLAPSPFLAVRVLKQIADDHRLEYPAASKALSQDAYVDDIPTGCDSVEDLLVLKTELIGLLGKAKFKLRKWSSNCWNLLQSLPEEDRCYDPIQLTKGSPMESPVKVLGIQWNPGRDVMFVKPTEFDLSIVPTKRELLSQLSKIYDPLGIAAPTTVLLKLIFQESWTAVIHWDELIRKALNARWRALVEDFSSLTKCQVPRYIAAPYQHIQLHGFADASMHAYDSEIVLHWLSAPPRNWNTYVCNRTAEILSEYPRSCWSHVRSEDNPADCASRGLHPSKLLDHELWWKGPSWMALPQYEWPLSTSKFRVDTHLEARAEERPAKPTTLHSFPDESMDELLINKISSWTRLIRAARNQLLRHIQRKAFQREYTQLENGRQLHAKSQLIWFSPFLDKDGLMRVGGRIERSTLYYNAKHPVIIPKSSPVAELLVRHSHVTNLHTGVDATFTNLRQQYWILGARNIVRKTVFQCKRCFLQRKSTSNQIMGELPVPRVQASRCFQHTGLDYAGPISIKGSTGRTPVIGKA
ncbi:uncharacterized protein [Drosophila suzukii]|uniref:Integrase zinc-binding domain-containing protein n=1 Tax=Drosophila suzukii TaxID=28584 RepID=A0ABM4TXJ3_DROSZ